MDWFKIGKRVHQGCILSPCLFNLHTKYIMWNAGLDESQAGIKIAQRNINNLRYADDTTLVAESKEELKNLLMKVKEESEKVGLKLKQWTRERLFFGAPKSLCFGTAAMKLKICFLLGRKLMTNLDSILKSRDISLPTKIHLAKAMAFPVVIFGCESWIIKKAECHSLILLNCCVGGDSWESPGLQGDPTSPSLRKSVLNIHWEDWCWSWNSNILATWCKELTYWKRPWCWERLKAGREGEDRGWDDWLASTDWLNWAELMKLGNVLISFFYM